MLTTFATLIVSVSLQIMTLKRPGLADKVYRVSTGLNGTGTEPGSGKTPLGKLRIYRKIGGSEPIYTIFESRKPVGVWDPNTPPCGGVLTRIMWLDGLEEKNATTLRRYIYIHATSHEEKIGTPYSEGCVMLTNKDMVELYDLVDENTRVFIYED